MKAIFATRPQKIAALWMFFGHLFFSPVVCGQIPQGVPKGTGPIDFNSTANVVIYIVLPAVVLIAFFVWRAAARRKKEKDGEV